MPKSGGWRKGKGNSVRRRWKPEPRTRSTHSTVPRRASAKVIDKRQFGDLQKANSSRRVTLQPSEPRLDLVPPKQRVAYKLLTRYDTCRQVRTDVFQKCTLIFVSRQRRRGGGMVTVSQICPFWCHRARRKEKKSHQEHQVLAGSAVSARRQ